MQLLCQCVMIEKKFVCFFLSERHGKWRIVITVHFWFEEIYFLKTFSSKAKQIRMSVSRLACCAEVGGMLDESQRDVSAKTHRSFIFTAPSDTQQTISELFPSCFSLCLVEIKPSQAIDWPASTWFKNIFFLLWVKLQAWILAFYF